MRSSLAALLILASTLASCGGGGNDSPPTPELAANRASAVITAGGTATRARISYAVDTAAPTEVNVTLPWTLEHRILRRQAPPWTEIDSLVMIKAIAIAESIGGRFLDGQSFSLVRVLRFPSARP